MSRGPGRWQRAILDELDYAAPYVVVDELLRAIVGDKPTRSQKVAIRRAADRLVDDRILEYVYRCRECGKAWRSWYDTAECCAPVAMPDGYAERRGWFRRFGSTDDYGRVVRLSVEVASSPNSSRTSTLTEDGAS